ncbi:MAG TPA: Gldg family protein [Candidatus Hydrogenedentes bacterium]|nr:Gldg family protein [Candidatus Hydrogenedentota bacterium]
MKNVMTIFRRDFAAYFTSPVGYIYMMVFVTLSVGLYITSFFIYPMADMRPYFDNLPILLCVFIPAVTMRIWAEERKENTWEMLLTFPMNAWELTVGKFVAALAFFALTILATITIPAMLFTLGNPDAGAVIGGYLGTLLLGAFFLALGILVSGFFKDQIVAFVVTLLLCFGFFLAGTDFIASYLDGRVAGLGSLLADLVGIFRHFGTFTKGVIDLSEVLFFVVWAVIFLSLNVLYIDGRNRPKARTIFSAAVVLSVVIGLLFNYVAADLSLFRVDLTQDKIYTIAPATRDILRNAESEVQVKLYITPQDKMPTAMRSLERDIVDKLEEMRLASGGKLVYDTVYLEAANIMYNEQENKDEKKEGEEAIEKRMLDKGVEPFSVQDLKGDEVTNKLVYSSIGVGYKDKAEEIVPHVIPDEMQARGSAAATVPVSQLEYRLANIIYKMTRPKTPVVALVAPKEAINIDPQMKEMLRQMGQPVPESDDPYEYLQLILEYEKYDVKRVDLTKESPLPEEYDTLVVVNPRALNERQRWEIARALRAGKSVVIAVQNYRWDYQVTHEGVRLSRMEESPAINELLSNYGVTIDEDVLMDVNSIPLNIQGGRGLAALVGQPINAPTHIRVFNTTMSSTSSITNRIAEVFYLWGSALKIDEGKLKEKSLSCDVLMRTSDQAWTVPKDARMTAASFQQPATGLKSYPLLAEVTGQFPDPYEGKPRPAWPKASQRPGMPPEEEPEQPDTEPAPPEITPAPGKLLVLGCSEMFRKNFLQMGNLDLFLNMVDASTLDDSLIQVRNRKPVDRTIPRPSEGVKTFWRVVNYGLANVVIAGTGLLYFMWRRRSRNAYTLAH